MEKFHKNSRRSSNHSKCFVVPYYFCFFFLFRMWSDSFFSIVVVAWMWIGEFFLSFWMLSQLVSLSNSNVMVFQMFRCVVLIIFVRICTTLRVLPIFRLNICAGVEFFRLFHFFHSLLFSLNKLSEVCNLIWVVPKCIDHGRINELKWKQKLIECYIQFIYILLQKKFFLFHVTFVQKRIFFRCLFIAERWMFNALVVVILYKQLMTLFIRILNVFVISIRFELTKKAKKKKKCNKKSTQKRGWTEQSVATCSSEK